MKWTLTYAIPHKDPQSLPPNSIVPGNDSDNPMGVVVLYEFHIVFHPVYQTAVLFFQISRIDGTCVQLSAEQLRTLKLPGGNSQAAWVSMDIHPVLGSPCYILHPCETTTAMGVLLKSTISRGRPWGAPTGPHSDNDKIDAHSSKHGLKSACDLVERRAPRFLLAWLSLVQPLTKIDPLVYQRIG